MKTKTIRFTSILLTLLMVFSMVGGAVSPSDFKDFPDDWSTEAMTHAVENGLLAGYADGRIAPSAPITRVEMATVLNRAFHAFKEASIQFNDVASSAWYSREVAKAIALETFLGTSANMFSPNALITREQAFTALARVLKLSQDDVSGLASFSDAAQISDWAKPYLAALVAKGYISGNGGALNPKGNMTRAEFAQVMLNTLHNFLNAAPTQTVEGNAIVVADNMTLSNVTISGDLIVASNISKLQLNNVIVKGRILVRGQYSATITIQKSKIEGQLVVYSPNEKTTIKTDEISTIEGQTAKLTDTKFEGTSTSISTPGGGGGVRIYSVNAAVVPNGTLTVDRSTAAAGEIVHVTATPAAGYVLGAIYVNGAAIAGNSFAMPANNVIVSATFTAVSYNVSKTNPANGTLTIDKTTATVGETVTVTVTPNAGYSLTSIEVDGIVIVGNTFVMPAKDVTVTATLTAISYTITATAPTNGTLVTDKQNAIVGEVVTVTATPSAGYKLDSVSVDGTPIVGNTFVMPAKNVVVTAVFSKLPVGSYSITVGATVNGSVSIDKSSAAAGETVTVTATPSAGYSLASIMVDGTAIVGNTFTMPAKNVTVTATFTAINYNVTVTAPTNGTLTTDKTTAKTGETVTVTATPSAGYSLASIMVDGTAIVGNTFTMPAKNVTVTATFTAINYNVTVTAPTNGTLTTDKATAKIGETVTVTATPSAGYSLASIMVDGTAIVGNTFTMPAKNVTVSATFTAINYNVTITAPINGTLTTDKATAKMGETVTVTATPSAGYQLDSIRVNGTLLINNTFTMPATDVTVTATFVLADRTVTVTPAANGNVTVDKATAKEGETVTITTTPADGYVLSRILVDGVALAAGVNTFVMPANNVTVTAEFTLVPAGKYAVNVTLSTNGTLVTDVSVASAGDLVTITATPNRFYKLTAILVDGTAIPTGTNSFVMPAHAVQVSAEFEEIQYAIRIDSPNATFNFLLDIEYGNADDVYTVARKILFQSYGGTKQLGGVFKRAYDFAVQKANDQGVLTGNTIASYTVKGTSDMVEIPAGYTVTLTPEMIQDFRDELKNQTVTQKRDFVNSQVPSNMQRVLDKIPSTYFVKLFDKYVDLIPDNAFSVVYADGGTKAGVYFEHYLSPIEQANEYYKLARTRFEEKFSITPTPEEEALYTLLTPTNFVMKNGTDYEILSCKEYYDLAGDILDALEAVNRGRDYFAEKAKEDSIIEEYVPKVLAKARANGATIKGAAGNDITDQQVIDAMKAIRANPDITFNDLLDVFGETEVTIRGTAKGRTGVVVISRVEVVY